MPTLIVALTTSPAFARNALHHHSKRAAPAAIARAGSVASAVLQVMPQDRFGKYFAVQACTASRENAGIVAAPQLACNSGHELDAARFSAAPDDLALPRMVRHERKSKAGSDFGRPVDDDLRPVFRNVKDAALMHGCLTVKRDPRPLMAAPTHLACWLR
jgi:hypothetical protein